MIILLNLVMLISMLMVFFLTGYYFYSLYIFKKYLSLEYPSLWLNEKSKARPFESSFQSAYRLFKKVDGNKIDEMALSPGLQRVYGRLKIIIIINLISFFLLLTSSITLSFVDPMK